MNIEEVTFTNEAGDAVLVKTDKGLLTSQWPSEGSLGDMIQAWIDAGNSIEAAPQPDLTAARSKQLSAVNTAYEVAVAKQLTATFPESEISSFDKQEQEARAWMADSSIATPYIDALLEGREQSDKRDLVERIIEKADQFAVAHGHLTGKRQKLEKQIVDAGTAAEVLAVTW